MSTPATDDARTASEASVRRGQLRRADKVMGMPQIEAFLSECFCGRTATVGADGFPYIVPNLFVWREGQVYLHTAKVDGHFLSNVRHDDRISFEVDEPGEVFPYGPVECDTSVSYRSVILFGRIRVIEDEAEKIDFFTSFMRKYAPPESWGREQGSFPRHGKTIVYAITPEAITGKQGPLPPLAQRWTKSKAGPASGTVSGPASGTASGPTPGAAAAAE
jgi:nitroimidazol reductase NimA-like FMN-containing flavoprotein (pyridoxamine 5'-phosphate oxidase superfamily)